MKNIILAVIAGGVIGAGLELWWSNDGEWSWFWPGTGALLAGLSALPSAPRCKGYADRRGARLFCIGVGGRSLKWSRFLRQSAKVYSAP